MTSELSARLLLRRRHVRTPFTGVRAGGPACLCLVAAGKAVSPHRERQRVPDDSQVELPAAPRPWRGVQGLRRLFSQGDEQRLYELIVRHFLACCSRDAQGQETTVEIDIAQERFVAHGLVILARNYLDVYPYDHWSDKVRRRRALGRGGCRAGSDRRRLPPQVLPGYERGSRFQPSTVEMVDGETSPPQLLTEADLIALMEKHGIGQWLVSMGPGGSGAFPASVTRALGSTPAPELQGGLEQLGARAGCRACERKSTVQVARSFLPRATALRRPRVGSCLLPLGVSAGPPCPGPVQRTRYFGPTWDVLFVVFSGESRHCTWQGFTHPLQHQGAWRPEPSLPGHSGWALRAARLCRSRLPRSPLGTCQALWSLLPALRPGRLRALVEAFP